MDACVAMALLFHYFWLAQFTWMLSVGVHLLQVTKKLSSIRNGFVQFNNENNSPN